MLGLAPGDALALTFAVTTAIALVVFVRVRTRTLMAERQLHKALEKQQAEVRRLRFALMDRRLPEPARNPIPLVPDPPADLTDALTEGGCVLFLGSITSDQLGVPSWQTTLAQVLDAMARRHPGRGWEDLERRLEAGHTELVADLLHMRVPQQELRETIVALTQEDANGEISPAFQQLAALPFSGVVTDLWTDRVAQMFAHRRPVQIRPVDAREAVTLLHRERFFVAQLHGSPHVRDTLLLSWEDYRGAVTGNPMFGRFVTSLLRARTVLFVGASEEDIEHFLLGSNVRSSDTQRHYALVPGHDAVALDDERLKARFGVQLLPFDAHRADEALGHFAAALAKAGETRAEQQHTPTPRRPAPRLTALRLENIGPFERLDIPLNESATVLVGDNGDGKSIILRALALGLAGESIEMAPAARELLRVGAPSGAIEIAAGRELYRTVLRRDRDTHSVRLVTESVSPVATGLQFAIGFPPLRGLSLRPPRGPAPSPAPAIGPGDLVPLATNELDPRLDDIQQWVINTNEGTRHGDPEIAALHRKQLDLFFDLIVRLSPDMGIRFDRVDRATWTVQLRTKDGILPISQISRGMTAFLSWVGLLVKRLLDFTASTDPQDWVGVLLLDEIDLHLHPNWQRMIRISSGRSTWRVPSSDVKDSTALPGASASSIGAPWARHVAESRSRSCSVSIGVVGGAPPDRAGHVRHEPKRSPERARVRRARREYGSSRCRTDVVPDRPVCQSLPPVAPLGLEPRTNGL